MIQKLETKIGFINCLAADGCFYLIGCLLADGQNRNSLSSCMRRPRPDTIMHKYSKDYVFEMNNAFIVKAAILDMISFVHLTVRKTYA